MGAQSACLDLVALESKNGGQKWPPLELEADQTREILIHNCHNVEALFLPGSALIDVGRGRVRGDDRAT